MPEHSTRLEVQRGAAEARLGPTLTRSALPLLISPFGPTWRGTKLQRRRVKIFALPNGHRQAWILPVLGVQRAPLLARWDLLYRQTGYAQCATFVHGASDGTSCRCRGAGPGCILQRHPQRHPAPSQSIPSPRIHPCTPPQDPSAASYPT